MTTPSTNPEDHTSQPRPCTVFSWDSRTGEPTVTHLSEPPRVTVQLDDCTCLTLDAYLALRDQSATPGEESPPGESR
jgi:hypothetical protein